MRWLCCFQHPSTGEENEVKGSPQPGGRANHRSQHKEKAPLAQVKKSIDVSHDLEVEQGSTKTQQNLAGTPLLSTPVKYVRTAPIIISTPENSAQENETAIVVNSSENAATEDESGSVASVSQPVTPQKESGQQESPETVEHYEYCSSHGSDTSASWDGQRDLSGGQSQDADISQRGRRNIGRGLTTDVTQSLQLDLSALAVAAPDDNMVGQRKKLGPLQDIGNTLHCKEHTSNMPVNKTEPRSKDGTSMVEGSKVMPLHGNATSYMDKLESAGEESAIGLQASSLYVEQFYTPRAWDLEDYDEVKIHCSLMLSQVLQTTLDFHEAVRLL
eukprot:jgi/Botrbrau1/5494/Bobra.27_1s0032.2